MLQWMGGSRRKLRASANSLKARQQQFFELRRQQQKERGKVANGAVAASNAPEGAQRNRSLDILGLEELGCGVPTGITHEPQIVAGADQTQGAEQATTSLTKVEKHACTPNVQAITNAANESEHVLQENSKPGSAHLTSRSKSEAVSSRQLNSRTKKTREKSVNSANKPDRGLGYEQGDEIDKRSTAHTESSLPGRCGKRTREVTRSEFPTTRMTPSQTFAIDNDLFSLDSTLNFKGSQSSRSEQRSESLEISKEFRLDLWGQDLWSPTFLDKRASCLPPEYIDAAGRYVPDYENVESGLWTLPEFNSFSQNIYLEMNESPPPTAHKSSQDSILLTGGPSKDYNIYDHQISGWSPQTLWDIEVQPYEDEKTFFDSPLCCRRISQEASPRSIRPFDLEYELEQPKSFPTSSMQVMDLGLSEVPTLSIDTDLDEITQAHGARTISDEWSPKFKSQRISVDDTSSPDNWFDKILPPTRSSSPCLNDAGSSGLSKPQTGLSKLRDEVSLDGPRSLSSASVHTDFHKIAFGVQTISEKWLDEFELQRDVTVDTSSADGWVLKPQSATSSGALSRGTGSSQESKSSAQFMRLPSESFFATDPEADRSSQRNLNIKRIEDEKLHPEFDSFGVTEDSVLNLSDRCHTQTNDFDQAGIALARTDGSLSSLRNNELFEFSVFMYDAEAVTGLPKAEAMIVYFPQADRKRETSPHSISGAANDNLAVLNCHPFSTHTKDEGISAASSKRASSNQRNTSEGTPYYDRGKEKFLSGASWAGTGGERFASYSAKDEDCGVVDLLAEKLEVDALSQKLREFELELLQSTSVTYATKNVLENQESYSPKPWDTRKYEFTGSSKRSLQISTDDSHFHGTRIGNQNQRNPSKSSDALKSWTAGCDILDHDSLWVRIPEETRAYRGKIEKTQDTSYGSETRGGNLRMKREDRSSQSRGQRESHGSNDEGPGKKRSKRELFSATDQTDDKVQRQETSLGYSWNSHKQKLASVGGNGSSSRQEALLCFEPMPSDKPGSNLKDEKSAAVLSQRRASLDSSKDSGCASGRDVAGYRNPETNRNSLSSNALGKEPRGCPSSEENLQHQATSHRSSLGNTRNGTPPRVERQVSNGSVIRKKIEKDFTPSSKKKEAQVDDQTQLLENEGSNNEEDTAGTSDGHGGSKPKSSFSDKISEYYETYFPHIETMPKDTSLTTSSKAKHLRQQRKDSGKKKVSSDTPEQHQQPHPEDSEEPDGQRVGNQAIPEQSNRGRITGPSLSLSGGEPFVACKLKSAERQKGKEAASAACELTVPNLTIVEDNKDEAHQGGAKQSEKGHEGDVSQDCCKQSGGEATEVETTDILTAEGSMDRSQGKIHQEPCSDSTTSMSPLQCRSYRLSLDTQRISSTGALIDPATVHAKQTSPSPKIIQASQHRVLLGVQPKTAVLNSPNQQKEEPAAETTGEHQPAQQYVTMLENFVQQLRFENRLLQEIMEKQTRDNGCSQK
ncbi:hypothetical protein R1flu_014293 [Riccia fluitans]|uniref:Uncharacterized protein n=1 Tax=Riccia fluitans TaxID=41844 RepID=A0ABD1YIU4_9MARC